MRMPQAQVQSKSDQAIMDKAIIIGDQPVINKAPGPPAKGQGIPIDMDDIGSTVADGEKIDMGDMQSTVNTLPIKPS